MVCLGSLPQILVGPFLNALTHLLAAYLLNIYFILPGTLIKLSRRFQEGYRYH